MTFKQGMDGQKDTKDGQSDMLEKWLIVLLIVGLTSLVFIICFPIDFYFYRRRRKGARERKKMMWYHIPTSRLGQNHGMRTSPDTTSVSSEVPLRTLVEVVQKQTTVENLFETKDNKENVEERTVNDERDQPQEETAKQILSEVEEKGDEKEKKRVQEYDSFDGVLEELGQDQNPDQYSYKTTVAEMEDGNETLDFEPTSIGNSDTHKVANMPVEYSGETTADSAFLEKENTFSSVFSENEFSSQKWAQSHFSSGSASDLTNKPMNLPNLKTKKRLSVDTSVKESFLSSTQESKLSFSSHSISDNITKSTKPLQTKLSSPSVVSSSAIKNKRPQTSSSLDRVRSAGAFSLPDISGNVLPDSRKTKTSASLDSRLASDTLPKIHEIGSSYT